MNASNKKTVAAAGGIEALMMLLSDKDRLLFSYICWLVLLAYMVILLVSMLFFSSVCVCVWTEPLMMLLSDKDRSFSFPKRRGHSFRVAFVCRPCPTLLLVRVVFSS